MDTATMEQRPQPADGVTIEKMPLTCIICPMGCLLDVTIEHDGETKRVIDVKDNACPRGPEYAQKELLNPTRTLTTTIAVSGGETALLPVKTAGEVPKDQLMNCMEIVRRITVKAPIKRGDILVRDILGTGIDIVACDNVAK